MSVFREYLYLGGECPYLGGEYPYLGSGHCNPNMVINNGCL